MMGDVDYTMLKKLDNGMSLSQEQIDILDKYNINYKDCKSLSDLIFRVETMLEVESVDELDNLLDILDERNYYENFNK